MFRLQKSVEDRRFPIDPKEKKGKDHGSANFSLDQRIKVERCDPQAGLHIKGRNASWQKSFKASQNREDELPQQRPNHKTDSTLGFVVAMRRTLQLKQCFERF